MKILQLITLLIIIFNRFLFTQIKHPLSIGFTLLIQTLLICLISGIFYQSFWFSYILFLIFLGGILVLFIYVTSLASNEIFSFSIKLLFTSIFIFLVIIILIFFIDKNLLLNYSNTEIQSIYNINSYLIESSLSLSKLYNYPTNLLTILLINYLLITLIATIKITKLYKGPLRPLFN